MSSSNTSASASRQAAIALSALPFMILLFVPMGFVMGSFKDIPILFVFVITSVYALATMRGRNIEERMAVFAEGAGGRNLLLMVWIFVMAGAFSSAASAMGAVDATVNATLRVMPPSMLLPGIFLAACFISLSIGTSVGTVVALTPIATQLATTTGQSVGLFVAAVMGGALFGDNLSFISDTTVAATRSQGCKMRDKFKANFFIALPAAVACVVAYVVIGHAGQGLTPVGDVAWMKVFPYIAVLVLALMGMHVLMVLLIGWLLTAVIGLLNGDLALAEWVVGSCKGIMGMAELIIVSMLAGGVLAVVRQGGGLDLLIRMLTRRVKTSRGGELCIGALVALTNLCTANNTIAILSTGHVAHAIAQRFGISGSRATSILDIFSCCVQGCIPYGAQMLMAVGLASVSWAEIVPYLYYPYALALCALLAIAVRKSAVMKNAAPIEKKPKAYRVKTESLPRKN